MILDVSRNISDLRTFVGEHERMLQHATHYAAEHEKRHVMDYPRFTPRTGKTQRATKARVLRARNGRLIRLSNARKVATFLEYGTKPHVIMPKKPGGRLVFRKGGQLIFARKVNHPGTRPYKFLYRAHRSGYRVLGESLEQGMRRAAMRFSS